MIHQTPQPGDVGLTSITGPVGRLIRFGQWLNGDGFGAYQHAFIVLPGDRLIDAMPGGAYVAPLSKYDDRDVLYVTIPGLTPAQRKAICDCALKYRDVPYSFVDYLALAAHRFHIPWPRLRRYIEATGHQICSQLADRAYLDAGLHIFEDERWTGYVTPMAIANELGSRARDIARQVRRIAGSMIGGRTAREAFRSGGTVVASGEGAVAAGGDITGVVITGATRRRRPGRKSL